MHNETLSAESPGAGLGRVVPFQTVLKDGYMMTVCVKDYMYSYADKLHSNKFKYNQRDVSNVSIVHYDAIVPKEDREAMSSKVCFNFCRTVPQMTYFGILNGRECYCEPYFKRMEADSSMCDVPCEGAGHEICGGVSKSQIFAMHSCDDTRQQLQYVEDHSDFLEDTLDHWIDWLEGYRTDMQKYSSGWQEIFGRVGDPGAADLMQKAKVYAGEIYAIAKRLEDKVEDPTDDMEDEARDIVDNSNQKDFKAFANTSKADHLSEQLRRMWPKLEAGIEESKQLTHRVHPRFVVENSPEAQYNSVMYFVDKSFEHVPSTCTGELVGRPMLYLNISECAMACDAAVHSCTAFGLFATTDGLNSLCFLFSKLKSVTYYTSCQGNFLQRSNPNHPGQGGKVACMAKSSKYYGTSLKPDPSGKCAGCLRTATKAKRCFEWPDGHEPSLDSELEDCDGPPHKC